MAKTKSLAVLIAVWLIASSMSHGTVNKTGKGFFRSSSGRDQNLVKTKESTRKSPRLKSNERRDGLKEQPLSARARLETEIMPLSPRTRPPLVFGDTLFSVFMPMGSRLDGYLRVGEGEKVHIFEMENLISSSVLAYHEGRVGRLRCDVVGLDQHCCNVYLETMDLLVEHPRLLNRLLSDEPDIAPMLVSLLAARRVLPQAIRALFEMELRSGFENSRSSEVFRSLTPATALVSALFKRPGALQEYRKNFVKFALNSLNRNYIKDKPFSVIEVLKESLQYLKEQEAPDEIILILRTLRKVPEAIVVPNYSVLLGSMFFLRFIQPALAQPKALCGLDVNMLESQALRMLARALQLVSNQVVPDEEHDFFPISEDLSKLYSDVRAIFFKIVVQPLPVIPVEDSLVLEAANMYSRVVLAVRNCQNQEIVEAIQSLQSRLGEDQMDGVWCEEDTPMFDEIQRISGFIGRLNKSK